MNSLAELKKKRGGLKKLKENMKVMKEGTSYPEDILSSKIFWSLKRDKQDNGYAIIRFLPSIKEDALPFITFYRHICKKNNKWFIENCPTTIKRECPVCEYNRMLWDTNKKDEARNNSRKKIYISNILVVNDPTNPENNGKIFMYKFGERIMNIIQEKLDPKFPDEEPVNVFDFWEGADFRLKCKKLDGFINYNSSTFDSSTSLEEENIKRIWKELNECEIKIKDLLLEKHFSTYENIKKKFDRFNNKPTVKENVGQKDSLNVSNPTLIKTPEPIPKTIKESSNKDLEYFSKLADEEL